MRSCSQLSIVLAALTLSGCFDSMCKVDGWVRYDDGEPMPRGLITFTSEDGQTGGYSGVAADGRFSVMYYEPGDGLPPGTYTISLLPPDPMMLSREDFQRAQELKLGPNWGIPEELRSPTTSYMTVEITRDLRDYEVLIERDRSQSQKAMSNPLDEIATAAESDETDE